ncbi:hypothetical protein ACFWPV_08640 [Streptomyces uncialis]|uniref:hypothetical protein n=1 Tax=Streptomyces uncialis TaxID=1048205 RepID=UPI0036583983
MPAASPTASPTAASTAALPSGASPGSPAGPGEGRSGQQPPPSATQTAPVAGAPAPRTAPDPGTAPEPRTAHAAPDAALAGPGAATAGPGAPAAGPPVGALGSAIPPVSAASPASTSPTGPSGSAGTPARAGHPTPQPYAHGALGTPGAPGAHTAAPFTGTATRTSGGTRPDGPLPGGVRPGSAPGPDTVSVLGAGAKSARLRHGDPVLRRVLRLARHAFGSSAARAVAESTELVAQVQQPVTTGRQIVVTSIRGGAGKTTVTALLSRTFNHFRHDPVLTLEADAALGTLPARLGVDQLRWTCTDLVQILRPSMQLTDVTGYLVPLTDGGWLLPGSQGRIGARIDIATYRTVMVALRRYFGVTLVDCETLPGEVARTALDTAQARVLVTPATTEGVASTGAVLDWLGSLPVAVLPRTVVVLTATSPDASLDAGAAAEALARSGVGVVVLPYDRHLASGGVIRTDHLGAATRQAATRLAAEVMQRAVGAR